MDGERFRVSFLTIFFFHQAENNGVDSGESTCIFLQTENKNVAELNSQGNDEDYLPSRRYKHV